MNKDQLLSLGLTEDQAARVLESFKGWVPPSRFNEVNEAKKNAEQQLSERDKQLDELKKSLTNDNKELKSKLEALQAENKTAKERYEQDLNTFKINNALDLALTQNGAKNLKAARALIDLEKIKIEGDKINGIEDQIKALLKSDDSKFLFEVKTEKNQVPTGMKAPEGTGNTPSKPVSEMNYSERVAYLAAGGTLN